MIYNVIYLIFEKKKYVTNYKTFQFITYFSIYVHILYRIFFFYGTKVVVAVIIYGILSFTVFILKILKRVVNQ